MLFNTIQYIFFLPIVVLFYYLLPAKIRYIWLLATSIFFYACWNAKCLAYVIVCSLVTYIGGLCLNRNKQPTSKSNHWIVFFVILVNLGILGYVKYAGFLLDLIKDLLSLVNISIQNPKFDILQPLGISFFTFRAVSYIIDVYRQKIKPEKNFLKVSLYISFFPLMIAGPIERADTFLDSIQKKKDYDYNNIRKGFLMILWGYILKLVLADRITILVDTIYANIESYNGWYLVVAAVMFSVQIYVDFNGYSMIASGSSKLLGIDTIENFQAPYFSFSVQDFWRKWHISLTTWFRDYVYIPLGGSRKGKVRKNINKLIVFLLSGLWHGADLSFIVWGGLNGLYQVVGEGLRPIRNTIVSKMNLHRETMGHKFIQGIVTFLLITFAWIFFRANSIAEAGSIVKSIFTAKNPWILFDGSLCKCGLDSGNLIVLAVALILLFILDYYKYKKISVISVILQQDTWFRCLVIIIAILTIMIFGKYGPHYNAASFIYAQF